ncbi:hypothetical protein HUB90_02925 [Wolbachia endosymbiont of Kradibia gibbosae]|uniref:hypothetical protein n=1 Tax=unclassified Wolbachia TaxID=2640676 RepID=UPI0018D894EE|nr:MULTISPECIES: hypothetical protein [unclassified Wolbachia]MBH5362026.1 hypothetical protein [Wolbachia endosymbiont of Kradibia gibbosae]
MGNLSWVSYRVDFFIMVCDNCSVIKFSGKMIMDIAYLAALISAAIIKIAAVILCAIMCISVFFILFKGIKEHLDSKGFLSLLKTVGVISIILSIISLPLIILSLTTPSPLVVGIVGGIVGAISIIPLIVAYILLSITSKGLSQQPENYQHLFLTSLLLFIGNIIAGAFIAVSGVFPICKVDSLSSLSAALESLPAVGIHALALTIATAIGVVIVIDLAKQAKEYISGKIMQAEKESVTDTHKEPDSKVDEAKEGNVKNERKVPLLP